MKHRVLVFPCGSEIGLEVFKSVNNSNHFELIGLNSIPDHGRFVYGNYIEGIGYYTDKNFINDLNKIIRQFNIDIIYPTMDSVIVFFKKNEGLINAVIVGSSLKTARICESKMLTYRLLSNFIKVPRVFKKNEVFELPVFVKPIIGYGSRNSYKLNSLRQLDEVDFKYSFISEYLPGEEYTVDCFTDLNRELIFISARQRIKTINGISVNTKTDSVVTEKLSDIARLINNCLEFKGSWFFQIKMDIDSIPTLLEVSCRFAGSSSINRLKGANFALANLFLTIGINVEFLLNDIKIELSRSFDTKFKHDLNFNTVFIDLDDTIIVENILNVDAISFIYKCINKKVEVILVTKNSNNVTEILKNFKISTLFNKIIQLSHKEEKSDYIMKENYLNSIFIDDSFSERKRVLEKLNIPVFGVDCISYLL